MDFSYKYVYKKQEKIAVRFEKKKEKLLSDSDLMKQKHSVFKIVYFIVDILRSAKSVFLSFSCKDSLARILYVYPYVNIIVVIINRCLESYFIKL